MLVVHDLDGRLLRANPAVERLLGYTPDEFMRLPMADVAHPDDLANVLVHLRVIAAGTDGRRLRGAGAPQGWPLPLAGLDHAGADQGRPRDDAHVCDRARRHGIPPDAAGAVVPRAARCLDGPGQPRRAARTISRTRPRPPEPTPPPTFPWRFRPM
jgi:PAS domain-containing protein